MDVGGCSCTIGVGLVGVDFLFYFIFFGGQIHCEDWRN